MVEQEEPNNETLAGTKRPVDDGDEISLKIGYKRDSMTVSLKLDSTVAELKKLIESHTKIPPDNQKLLYKGQLKDEQRLRDTNLKNGSKLMILGTVPTDAATITNQDQPSSKNGTSNPTSSIDDWDAPSKLEIWADEPQHKKIIDAGVPEGAWPGIPDKQVPLTDDQTYIPAILISMKTKVRLTFKQDIQQLWIGSAASTKKVSYSSVTSIKAQIIPGNPGYSILKVQLGASGNLWMYWVPSQYVSGIKMRVLGVGSLLE